VRGSVLAILGIVLAFSAGSAVAQPVESPSPGPLAAPAAPLPSPSPSLPPAGVVPPSVALTVTGAPADAAFLDARIREAIDRRIRPTLRPGASIRYGPIAPWPLLPLAAGSRAAVNVTVTIAGDDVSTAQTGVTSVVIDNVVVAPQPPALLFLSDDPEYLPTEGLVFQGNVERDRGARLYYYHDDIGVPRDLDVVLTAAVPSRTQIIGSAAGPDLDVMSVGHTVSRDFLLFAQRNEGEIVDVVPGKPLVIRHHLILQGELVAGAMDFHVMTGGAVTVSLVASPAGGSPERYLSGPRVPFDGHHRHGTFDLSAYGAIAASYTVGGPPAALKYGGQTPTPHNLDPNDRGRDYGDYGVVHRITFTLANPSDTPHLVYLYEKPLGGPVRSTFLVDGQLKELGCARLPQPYWLTTYQLPPHSTSASTTLTMTDGGSFYPLEFGVTDARPLPYTPQPQAADGCSPSSAPTPQPTPSQVPSAAPTAPSPAAPSPAAAASPAVPPSPM
jgi:hypothetical protein